MARTHRHKEEPVFLLQDTPDALREIGVDDEQEALAAVREPAQALEGASFLQAVRRFYRFYTLGRGHASRSEVLWALLYLTLTTGAVLGVTIYLGMLSEDPHMESLIRVLYMLMVTLTPVWIIVHILPLSSLLSRARGKH